MEKYMYSPDTTLFGGMKVNKDTELAHSAEGITQTLKDLVLHTVTVTKGDGYEVTRDSVVTLNEGDVVIFASDEQGWVKPLERFVRPSEAIAELECIKEDGDV